MQQRRFISKIVCDDMIGGHSWHFCETIDVKSHTKSYPQGQYCISLHSKQQDTSIIVIVEHAEIQ